jgi:uncharacterized protein YlaI
MNNLIITENKDNFKIQVKRFYLPYNIECKCPKCNKIVEFNDNDYITYPILNKELEINFYCENCYHEFEKKIVIDIVVKEVV